MSIIKGKNPSIDRVRRAAQTIQRCHRQKVAKDEVQYCLNKRRGPSRLPYPRATDTQAPRGQQQHSPDANRPPSVATLREKKEKRKEATPKFGNNGGGGGASQRTLPRWVNLETLEMELKDAEATSGLKEGGNVCVVLNSPRSVEACKKAGIEAQDLIPKTFDEVLQTVHAASPAQASVKRVVATKKHKAQLEECHALMALVKSIRRRMIEVDENNRQKLQQREEVFEHQSRSIMAQEEGSDAPPSRGRSGGDEGSTTAPSRRGRTPVVKQRLPPGATVRQQEARHMDTQDRRWAQQNHHEMASEDRQRRLDDRIYAATIRSDQQKLHKRLHIATDTEANPYVDRRSPNKQRRLRESMQDDTSSSVGGGGGGSASRSSNVRYDSPTLRSAGGARTATTVRSPGSVAYYNTAERQEEVKYRAQQIELLRVRQHEQLLASRGDRIRSGTPTKSRVQSQSRGVGNTALYNDRRDRAAEIAKRIEDNRVALAEQARERREGQRRSAQEAKATTRAQSQDQRLITREDRQADAAERRTAYEEVRKQNMAQYDQKLQQRREAVQTARANSADRHQENLRVKNQASYQKQALAKDRCDQYEDHRVQRAHYNAQMREDAFQRNKEGQDARRFIATEERKLRAESAKRKLDRQRRACDHVAVESRTR